MSLNYSFINMLFFFGLSFEIPQVTFSDDVFAVCFQAAYTSNSSQDCIIGTAPASFNSPFITSGNVDPTDTLYSEELTAVTGTASCRSSFVIPYRIPVSETQQVPSNTD